MWRSLHALALHHLTALWECSSCVTLAIVIFAHGARNSWAGLGTGLYGHDWIFTSMGLPWLHSLRHHRRVNGSPQSVVAGFLTRFVAASYILIMLGAVAMVHWPNGFFMNWFGATAGEDFEYHLLIIGMSVALLLKVAGLVCRPPDRQVDGPTWMGGTQPLHAFAQSKQ